MNRYVDSERRFQHVLEACGVNKSLSKLGVKEGDTVIVGDVSIGLFSLLYHIEFLIQLDHEKVFHFDDISISRWSGCGMMLLIIKDQQPPENGQTIKW